ncbi:MAG: response regulator, partial [Pseudomonadales bacterium]|nr:response regulator [Pseudomonadales bacterium]
TADIEANWQTSVRTSFNMLPGVQALNYVDNSKIIRLVYPSNDNAPALGANLSQHPDQDVRSALDRAQESDAMYRTGPLELLQSGLGFAIYKRIIGPSGEPLGFVNGVFRIDEVIETCFSGRNLRGQLVYQISEQDGFGIYSVNAGSDPQSWQLSTSYDVSIADRPWTLTLAPAPRLLQELDSFSANLWLYTGLILIALLAVLIRAWLINQARLKESRARYQLLVENQSDLIIKLDPRGCYRYVSPSFCRFVGKDEEELLGTSFLNVVDERDRQAAQGLFASMTLERPQINFTQRVRHQDELRWISWAASVVVDDEAHSNWVVAVGRDITRQMAMETQVAHSDKMRAVGELAGGISHDFNNLLQVILANIELLLVAPDRGDKETRLENIRQAVNNGIELTNRLSTLSRQDSGATEVFDLFALVNQSLSLIERSLPETIELSSTTSAQSAMIEGNKSQLERVLLNLCFNARDAIEGDGRIEIRCSLEALDEEFCQQHENLQPGLFACIDVCDDGKGMDNAVQARIFEPFFSTKSKGKGSGLGLANCYSIVTQLKGLILVKSRPGEGSQFRVYVPLSDQHTSQLTISGQEAATAPGDADENHETMDNEKADSPATSTVLVVDDNEDLLTTIQSFLEFENYQVLRAVDGEQAVQCFQADSEQIDFVIMDLMMPIMDGKTAADKMREIQPQLPILFVSGYVGDSEILEALQREVLLRKPFTRIELMGAINRLLRRQASKD